jgi:hypothetical protein
MRGFIIHLSGWLIEQPTTEWRAFLHLPREAANITFFFESRTRP